MQAHGLQPVLRADGGLPEQPSGAKMVSLDLLLGANSTPATPRDPDPLLQAVDPLDPLVQQLVQDKSFLTAVQTSQLHAAASAAVRLLRSHFTAAAGSEFKRPPDRRVPRDGFVEGADATPRVAGVNTNRHPHGSLVVQRQVVDARHREALRLMRTEVLQLEDVIPWNSVRRTWKGKRTTWRRQIKQTEVIPEFATRLKELKAALLTDDHPLPGCGNSWRSQLEACIAGRGSYGLLSAAWEELRGTVRNWLEGRSKPAAACAAQLQAGAVRAVQAMQAALAGGGGDAALLQVPLESIVGNDSGAGLHAVRHAIELEQRILGARLAARASSQQPSEGSGGGGGGGEGGGAAGDPQQAAGGGGGSGVPPGQTPLVSYFSSISAAWCDSDFDSGADSDAMEAVVAAAGAGGASDDLTDLDSDYDP